MNQPHDTDLEEVVLGAIMLEPPTYYQVSQFLTPETFYKSEHRHIFEAIKSIYDSGESADIVTTVDALRKSGKLQMVGGPGTIAQLTNRIGSSAHIENHSAILMEMRMLREQIDLAHRILHKCETGNVDAFELNEYVATRAYEISSTIPTLGQMSMDELAKKVKEDMQSAANNDGVIGHNTGFKEIDAVLGGNMKTDMRVIAARPGMGKTAYMLCEAFYIGVICKQPVVIFSIEMSQLQLFKRLILIGTTLTSRIFKGSASINDRNQMDVRIKQLIESNIILVDNCKTMSQIRSRSKKEAAKYQHIATIYIDYIQRMSGPGRSREEIVSEISRSIKDLAMDLDVPVTALSQLSRACENRPKENHGRKPILSDLRESGSIEQDADSVAFLYRPGYYGITEDKYGSIDPQLTYFCVVKNRHGKLQDVKLRFKHDITTFENYETPVEASQESDQSEMPF